MMRIPKILILLSLPAFLYAAEPEESDREDKQLKVGNFLLPTSQQPSPLLSLGQNIVGKGDTMLFVGVNPLCGPKIYTISLVPYFLYGITDKCSVVVGLPFSFLKNNKSKSAGLADIYAQIEYAYYEYTQPTYTYQATCLAALLLPTGSTRSSTTKSAAPAAPAAAATFTAAPIGVGAAIAASIPALGTGATGFLFGGTVSYYSIDWLWFVSAGGTIATKGRTLRAGSNFLYQGGFGKNITTHNGWIFTWIIELNGAYTTRQQVCCVTQRNSGGNVLYLTPSLWASSERFIAQAGVTLLPAQHLFGGCQTKYEIGGMISLEWKFNT